MGECSSQLAWLFHVLSSFTLLKRHICKIVKAIRHLKGKDAQVLSTRRTSVEMQHFKNQNKGNIH